MTGVKFDADKPRWDIAPWREIEQEVEVLTAGAKKYSPDNWQRVPDARDRYFAALMRHIIAWRKGEILDSEDGKPHLAHAACNIHFLQWFDNEKNSHHI